MSALGGTDLLLFVAGEPGAAIDSMRDVETSIMRRMTGSIVGDWWRGRGEVQPGRVDAPPLQTEDRGVWHLPPQQIQVINLVFDIAQRVRKKVGLIDVNRPSTHVELVEWWVGPEGILPLLVRADGARLQGIEQFVPRTVRRFVGGR